MTATAVHTTADASPLTADADAITAASALQNLLPGLVALTLDAKQAHWNVTGAGFLPLHALTDEIAAATRVWADRVAERALALGFAVDARPRTVATVAGEFPGGRLGDRETITALGAMIHGLAAAARAELGHLEKSDAVAHDIFVDVLEGLDKYRWMLRAQAQ
jgi:starvation-inducible DNA-binding protein